MENASGLTWWSSAATNSARGWCGAPLCRTRAGRRRSHGSPRRPLTVSELVDEYLDQHIAEANTIATLTARLKRVTGTFGDIRIDRLQVPEIAAWRKRLPEGSAWHIRKALRQVLAYALRADLLDENPASKVPNPSRSEPRCRSSRVGTSSKRWPSSSARHCR